MSSACGSGLDEAQTGSASMLMAFFAGAAPAKLIVPAMEPSCAGWACRASGSRPRPSRRRASASASSSSLREQATAKEQAEGCEQRGQKPRAVGWHGMKPPQRGLSLERMKLGAMIPRNIHGEKSRARGRAAAACRQRSRASAALCATLTRARPATRDARFEAARATRSASSARRRRARRGRRGVCDATGTAGVPLGAGACAGCTERARACSSRRQREHVADEQTRVVALVVGRRRRERAVEDPAVAVALEQLRGHRRPRHDALRVEQPAESPVLASGARPPAGSWARSPSRRARRRPSCGTSDRARPAT